MTNGHDPNERDRWARLRFAIVGPLLAAPPAKGELQAALLELSRRTWQHPMSGAAIRFGASTIERWLHAARRAADPVASLKGRLRPKSGHAGLLAPGLIEAMQAQYHAHRSWSVQLHYDNLKVALGEGELPSYATVRRYFRQRGFDRTPRRRPRAPDTALPSAGEREVRSFEVDHVNALWHTDAHHGSRNVLSAQGSWVKPMALCVLDDRSRLVCHLQWYLHEDTEQLVHCVSQGLQRRALPRSLYSDCGAAMRGEEFQNGLHTLGIMHQTTRPYAAYMNGKQEHLRAHLEGRLMAMLEGVEPLTLALLNQATQAWVEHEYQRAIHRELGCTPLQRYLQGPEVGRPCPDSDTLRRAFRIEVTRTQRQSDGTVSLHAQRFEIPSRYRHLKRVCLRYARWDLTRVELVDAHSGTPLSPLYPLDKSRNADAIRRSLQPPSPEPVTPAVGMAPLLKQLMAQYAATGLPPAYLPTGSEVAARIRFRDSANQRRAAATGAAFGARELQRWRRARAARFHRPRPGGPAHVACATDPLEALDKAGSWVRRGLDRSVLDARARGSVVRDIAVRAARSMAVRRERTSNPSRRASQSRCGLAQLHACTDRAFCITGVRSRGELR